MDRKKEWTGGKPKMKALSIKEPWISMIANGEKTIETRTWYAPTFLYNQSFLLVGSQKPAGEFAGMAACVATLADCRIMRSSDEDAACCEVYPRAISWVLKDIQKVMPFPVKGKLCVYGVDLSQIKLILL